MDRNLADAHAQIGNALFLLGRGAETEVHVNKAFQLSPRDVFVHRWLFYIALAKFQLKQDAEGLDFLLRSIEANRTFAAAHFTLAARLALLGSREKAHAAARAGLAINPGYTIRRVRNHTQSDNPTYLANLERFYEGLRLAGVPEG